MITSRFDCLTFLSNSARSGQSKLSLDAFQSRAFPNRLTWLRLFPQLIGSKKSNGTDGGKRSSGEAIGANSICLPRWGTRYL